MWYSYFYDSTFEDSFEDWSTKSNVPNEIENFLRALIRHRTTARGCSDDRARLTDSPQPYESCHDLLRRLDKAIVCNAHSHDRQRLFHTFVPLHNLHQRRASSTNPLQYRTATEHHFSNCKHIVRRNNRTNTDYSDVKFRSQDGSINEKIIS